MSAPGTVVAHDPLAWLAPAPLWEAAGGPAVPLERPWLVESGSDDVVEDFLALVAGDPAALAGRGPATGAGTVEDPLVLYRPLHGRHYLVAGSLVCRRLGLPDRAVDLRRGHTVGFVIRRLAAGGEQAWVPARGWVPAAGSVLADGEQEHPMHAAPVGAVDTGPAGRLLGLDAPGRRSVLFGYVPVAGAAARPAALADPGAALAADPDRAPGDDPRLLEVRARVTGPWAAVLARGGLPADAVAEPSLFVLLDLRDWLERALPAVLGALVAGGALAAGSAAEALRAHLAAVSVGVDGAARPLGDVLDDLAPHTPLLRGIGDPPAERYDVRGPAPASPDALGGRGAADTGLAGAALDEADAAVRGGPPPPVVPPELAGAVVPRPAGAGVAPRHHLRLVYRHPPCAPVLSAPSATVRFAGDYDPDAPARTIRIEMPDPRHLRRFRRGVAIDMPPALRNTLERITPDILKGDEPGPGGDWTLGMVCTFSLQIVMMVAFVVMFVFLVLLNIVFWWLPLLKVCFPVPTRRGADP